jgi:transposase-like protein
MYDLSSTPIEEMSFWQLDALREQLRLSQVRLCQRGDINPASYTKWRRWARGDTGGAEPRPRTLRAVREVLMAELVRTREIAQHATAA